MRNHTYKAGTAVYQSLGATQVFELPRVSYITFLLNWSAR